MDGINDCAGVDKFCRPVVAQFYTGDESFGSIDAHLRAIEAEKRFRIVPIFKGVRLSGRLCPLGD